MPFLPLLQVMKKTTAKILEPKQVKNCMCKLFVGSEKSFFGLASDLCPNMKFCGPVEEKNRTYTFKKP